MTDTRQSLLAACYRNSLTLAESILSKSIAFPAISTGAFGYPPSEAAAVASAALKEFLSASDALKEVRLMFFHQRDAKTFLRHHQFVIDPVDGQRQLFTGTAGVPPAISAKRERVQQSDCKNLRAHGALRAGRPRSQ